MSPHWKRNKFLVNHINFLFFQVSFQGWLVSVGLGFLFLSVQFETFGETDPLDVSDFSDGSFKHLENLQVSCWGEHLLIFAPFFKTYETKYPLKTHIFPENWWLEDKISVKNGPFSSGDMFIFGGEICPKMPAGRANCKADCHLRDRNLVFTFIYVPSWCLEGS